MIEKKDWKLLSVELGEENYQLQEENKALQAKNDALVARVARLEQHRDILADHMAEVKAISDGCNHNTLSDVVNHCIKEIENQIPKTNETESESLAEIKQDIP